MVPVVKTRITIVTALSGDRDNLTDPPVVHPGVEYHAFVEKDWPCKVWQQHKLIPFSNDMYYANRRNAKIYKILIDLFLPDFDFYFWTDPTHTVVPNPAKICEEYLIDSDIAVFKHLYRDCVYKESKFVSEVKYDYPDLLDSQMIYYKASGFSENYGLYELPAFIRKNTLRIKALNMMWWEQICKYSSRDQLSFPYVLWKMGIIPAILPGFANGINPKTGNIGYNDIIPQTKRHHY